MASEPYEPHIVLLHAHVAEASLAASLLRIASVAVDAVGADMAGLTIIDAEGRPTTAIFTDDTAPEIDQTQYDADRGPCLEAYRTNQVVLVESTDRDTRWPEFAEAARAHGIHSSLSLPLVDGGEGFGALNLYARAEQAFDVRPQEAVRSFAAHAASAVLNVVAYWQQTALVEQLQAAIASRAVIEQAKGVIMASSGCSPDEAFRLLRQQSQAENVKLREVAARLVQQQQRPHV